jgi:UDP-galactopyranose mutase
MTYPLLPIWENCHTGFMQKERLEEHAFIPHISQTKTKTTWPVISIFKEQKGKHDPSEPAQKITSNAKGLPSCFTFWI